MQPSIGDYLSLTLSLFPTPRSQVQHKSAGGMESYTWDGGVWSGGTASASGASGQTASNEEKQRGGREDYL